MTLRSLLASISLGLSIGATIVCVLGEILYRMGVW